MATTLTVSPVEAPALSPEEKGVAGALMALGVVLWWACRYHSSMVPVWLPWDFSPLWYTAFALTIGSYVRGWRIMPQSWWRTALFTLGTGLTWAVIQTRFDYLAQHMFFLNRIQSMVMHHLGPFLVSLAWPWPTMLAGMPRPMRRMAEHRWLKSVIAFARQPEIACLAFVGILALWLVPSIHFVAMVNPWLYQVMNWSMVLDGLLFWSLVLDPRPPEEARIGYPARAIVGVIVMFPQIAIGATICFANHDLYTFYSWCGRLTASISPISDQRIGGVVVWESPSMMSIVSLILVLNTARRHGERLDAGKPAIPGGVSSASWTGR